MRGHESRFCWKYLIIPVLATLVLAIYPQVGLWLSRGSEWSGTYVVSNYDEVAYSAYVNALIDGAPRKNDPFLGTRETPETPQPETLYSIQFIPAYAIALPARLFGVSASTAFIFLICIIAVFSAVAVFWLLHETTQNDLLSAVGAVVVLCLGTAAAYQGELRYLIEGRILTDFFPYLRRYQPGAAFPLFFVFCVFVWRALRAEATRTLTGYSLAAGSIFVVLVYSYFYLWTAAAAWLVCYAAFTVALNRMEWRKILTSIAVIGAAGIAALVPYFYLLSLRSQNLDSVQLLTHTRAPVLASPSLLIGLIVAAVVFVLVWRGLASLRDPRIPLILSFALTPIILFNQQIITGRSLQPVHYELFISNYIVLVAAVILISINVTLISRIRRGLVYVGLAAFSWGLFEAVSSTSRNALFAEIRDASVPAIRHAAVNSTVSPGETVVLATNFVTADFVPSVAPIRVLWNPHTSSAGGVTNAENKRLFYLYLYYSGYTDDDLAEALRMNVFEVSAAIFGSERALPALGQDAAAITSAEIRTEAEQYADFVTRFDQSVAESPRLSFIIVPAQSEPDLSNLDRWYLRNAAYDAGLFRVYRLTPRPASSE
jgi:hypothetical protein